jgi:hypothetical protein
MTVSQNKYGCFFIDSVIEYIYESLKKASIMNSLLYIIAVILVIGWAIGVFFFTLGGLIHVLLVIAVISVLLGLTRRPTAI